MKIENQTDLEKLIKLLRKTGVESLKFGEIELKLSPEAPESTYKKKRAAVDRPERDLSPEEKMKEEQKILFWSSTPPGLENDEN